MSYIKPIPQNNSIFTCPYCHGNCQVSVLNPLKGKISNYEWEAGVIATRCHVCKGLCFFALSNAISKSQGGTGSTGHKLIHPTITTIGPEPNEDMPEKAKGAFEEARLIAPSSKRAGIAMLRLSAEYICKELGAEGKQLNAMIIDLIKKSIIQDDDILEKMELTRLFGNGGIHATDSVFSEGEFIAVASLLNMIVEDLVSKKKNQTKLLSLFGNKDQDSVNQKKNLLNKVQENKE